MVSSLAVKIARIEISLTGKNPMVPVVVIFTRTVMEAGPVWYETCFGRSETSFTVNKNG